MSENIATKRAGVRVVGLVFILLISLLAWLSVAVYNKAFSSAVIVTMQADRVGNQLTEGSDVKARGMIVGEVRAVRVTAHGADIELALQRHKLSQLPGNVTARLLPKSLFGQRYVSLVWPEVVDPRPLTEGAVIVQDTTAESIEIEQALNNLLPVLQAVQPHKLSSALGAVSQAFDGRGEQLGATMVRLNAYLEELNPHLPTLQSDIEKFADVLATYDVAGPDIIDALGDLTTTSQTIAERAADLDALLRTGKVASDELTAFLRANSATVIALAAESRPVLEILARHSSTFPCLFDAVTALKPLVEGALGTGTNQPGLRGEITVKPPRSNTNSQGGALRC